MYRFAALILSTALFAADSQIDVRIDTDPNDLLGKTSVNVVTTTSVQNENHAFLFTPEMSFYAHGGVDFSLSIGHRHRWKDFVWGHHIFFDRSKNNAYTIDQMGTGLDLFTKRFDFRVNYYQPRTKRIYYYFYDVTPCRWADAEIFFKTKYFGVGTGPMYNIDMKSWAMHSRIVVPLQNCTVGFGVLTGDGKPQGILSVSFHLFGPRVANALNTPPSHVQKSNIYYHFDTTLSVSDIQALNDGSVKDLYSPHIVNYIDQTEDEVTMSEKAQEEADD